MEKIKVSRFEYVFIEAAAKKGTMPDADKYEPYTEEEELKMRSDKLSKQFNKFTTPKDKK